MNFSMFGSKIKTERKRQNITLEKLAERIGISRNFLWEIEAGRKAPALNTLYRLAIALNISIDYLMGTTDKNKHINDGDTPTEQELQVTKILEYLNTCEIKELQFISNILEDFSKYIRE